MLDGEALNYRIVYPDGLDEYDYADIEAKGWLDGVRVIWDGGDALLSIYDEVRLAQVVRDEIGRLGFFAATILVIIPHVTRDEIQRAVGRMAERGFHDLNS